MADESLDEQLGGAARPLRAPVAEALGVGAGLGAVLRAGRRAPRDRVLAAGRRTDDGHRCELLVVREHDGSWALHAPPFGPGVAVSRVEALFVAESIVEWRAVMWFARSFGDRDTHRGEMIDGAVRADCGIEFAPVVLACGRPGWEEPPPDLSRICGGCARGGHRTVSREPRDACGVSIRVGCRVEQVAVATERGALPARVPRRGEVTGRGDGFVTVRLFDTEGSVVSVRPCLLRVLDGPGS